jgi:glycosyltransferase involved in cell wall biosynthesis
VTNPRRSVAFCAPPANVAPARPPNVSVVIAAYQAAAFIGDAIESVLAQTAAPDEIIVCDDGSTDHLAQALAPYHHRITLLANGHHGEAAAKNAAIRAASTEFVGILDADDVFLPRRVEALMTLASVRPDLDLLTTDAFLTVSGQRARCCYNQWYRFESHDQRAAILRHNFIMGFVTVRRDRFLEIGGFDERLGPVNDWDCWIRMILEGSRAGLVDEPLAEYRLHGGNITADRTAIHRGRLTTLLKTAARSDLTEDERAAVQHGIAQERQAVALWATRDALKSRDPDARRRCLSLLVAPQVGTRARLNASAALVAPRLAGSRLQRRERLTGRELAGGIRALP